MRSLPIAALLSFTSLPAFAQVAADLQFGNGDAMGIVGFFYLFFCYVVVRDAFKEGQVQGLKALALCAALGVGAWMFHPLRVVMILIFVASFINFTWRSLK